MLSALHRTGLVFFPAFDWAISPDHPEREERLLYTQDQVFEEGVLDIAGIEEFKADLATRDDVNRVHFCVPDVWSVTTESHLISAGGAKTIGMAVMDRRVERGFALVRPPGHHAMRVVHGSRGFCAINIEAVMIEFLRRVYGIRRVAIIDTDCHHGDGTQDIYWHDPDTLFISMHQDGRTLYPGSGFTNELGGPNAIGTTLNIPLPPHTSEEGFLYALDHVVLPVLDAFQPELVVNSAGQDNHFTDPITRMNFTAQGYATLTARLKPHIAVLEGGYSIEGALPYVNLGILLALAGLDTSGVREPNYEPERLRQSPAVSSMIARTCDQVMQSWNDRAKLQAKLQSMSRIHERSGRVFYDTDGIVEMQHERVRSCSACGGCWCIDSSSDRGSRILAVHIPRGACPACAEQGQQWFDDASPSRFDYVFLQNRPADRFETRKRA